MKFGLLGKRYNFGGPGVVNVEFGKSWAPKNEFGESRGLTNLVLGIPGP